ncbi:MAG: glycosyltransferase [Candidatus Binatia bacterium]
MRPATKPPLSVPLTPSARAQQRAARPVALPASALLQERVDSLSRELKESRDALALTRSQLEAARNELVAARGALEATRTQLEEAHTSRDRLQGALAHIHTQTRQLDGTLGATAVQLRAIAKSAPYRLAHLLRRIGADLIKGSRRERNAALRWLRRRLLGRQLPREQAKNPLLDEAAGLWGAQEALAAVADHLHRLASDAATPAHSVPSSATTPAEPVHACASTVGGTRARSRGLLRRYRLNPYEFLFDTYRRSREKIFPLNWQRIGVPYQPRLVSIVVPSYNGADFIREALDSILAQTYPHLEVIAIDDGSTDSTSVILDEYARNDPRVTVVHQDNRQLPRTLSRGFRLARGEFLTWTSVDNRLKPTCIETLVASLRRHPDWDMVYANFDIIGEGGQPLRGTTWLDAYQSPHGSEHIRLPGDTAELNVWPNNYIGGAFLYRARVAWALGDYSPARFLMEDYDYWMRINELMTLRHADFDDCVYEYRVHNGSLTSKDRQLGITRNRTKLMVFDDFRRSAYLSKTLWVVTSDGSAAANRLAEALQARVRQAKHMLVRPDEVADMALPRLWMPTAWVHIAAGPDHPPRRPAVGALAARILVRTDGDPELPPGADWETYISTHPAAADALRRRGDDYAGWWSVCDVGDLFAFCDLRAKTPQIAEIDALATDRLTHAPGAVPRLSVVICADPRSASLHSTLRAVAAQTLAPSEYEVVVANTAPTDPGARQAFAALRAAYFGSAPERMRLVDCPLPGLPYAKNAGISEARGEHVVFLAHDAIPNPDCLEWFLRGFDTHPSAGVIGGHVRLNVPTPRPAACPAGREILWNQFLTRHTAYVEATQWWEYPFPDNWAARRRVLVEMGGLRCNWGHIGAEFKAGQEIAAASLARQLGYTVGIEPRAVALHHVAAERYTEADAVTAIHAGITAHYRLQQCLYLPRRTSSGLWRDLKRALRNARGDRKNVHRSGDAGTSRIDERYDREILRARLHVFWLAMTDLFLRSRRAVTNG